MTEALIAISGILIGGILVGVIGHFRRKPAAEVARQLLEESQSQRIDDLNRVISQVKDAFGSLSRDALMGNSEEFLKLAKTRLEQQTLQGESTLQAKKELIDKGLSDLRLKVGELNSALQNTEKSRSESFGKLFKELENANQTRLRLQETTEQLSAALASPSHRGQWGERMAEDVLRLAGLIEGVNYRKQSTTESGTKPDFVFLLPTGPHVNMDVKFPLSNYLKFLQCQGDESETHKKAFLRDVRDRVKEVTTRDYINPAAGSIDFVLVFIPNEQLYGFIHEQDPDLLEYAMRRKVVLCSPLTLFAILAVIRQAADNFRLHEASNEILELLAAFGKQWEKYGEVVDKLGKNLDVAMKSYHDLTGTRSRMLQRQVDKIDELRVRRMGDGTENSPFILPDES